MTALQETDQIQGHLGLTSSRNTPAPGMIQSACRASKHLVLLFHAQCPGDGSQRFPLLWCRSADAGILSPSRVVHSEAPADGRDCRPRRCCAARRPVLRRCQRVELSVRGFRFTDTATTQLCLSAQGTAFTFLSSLSSFSPTFFVARSPIHQCGLEGQACVASCPASGPLVTPTSVHLHFPCWPLPMRPKQERWVVCGWKPAVPASYTDTTPPWALGLEQGLVGALGGACGAAGLCGDADRGSGLCGLRGNLVPAPFSVKTETSS